MVKRGNGMTRNLHFDAVELLATRESGGGPNEQGEQPEQSSCCRPAADGVNWCQVSFRLSVWYLCRRG